MDQITFKTQYEAYRQKAEESLARNAEWALPEISNVCGAARYSLLGGGKRIRAVLVLAVCELLQGDGRAAADFAAAVEMVHAYSLIHDDLPCMDNDDYRRGKPSCHKAYGEANAMLAGDVLLTEAFEVAARAPLAKAEQRVLAIEALSRGAGSRGMVYGQELDLRFEAGLPSGHELREVHRYKTGALIKAAVEMGFACTHGSEPEKKALCCYAESLGLVFQIIDDVLDETATSAELGKPAGSDAANGKVTYATLYGVAGAKKLAADIEAQGTVALKDCFGEKAAFLNALSNDLLTRKC